MREKWLCLWLKEWKVLVLFYLNMTNDGQQDVVSDIHKGGKREVLRTMQTSNEAYSVSSTVSSKVDV